MKCLGKRSVKKKTLLVKKLLLGRSVARDQKENTQFFATERINLPRGKVLLCTSYPSSGAGSLRTSPSKIVLQQQLNQLTIVPALLDSGKALQPIS